MAIGMRSWTKKMQGEVEHLPDTLAALRESSVHIRKVSEDLTEVVASLRRVTDALDAAGLAEATEVIKKSSAAMRITSENMETAQKSFADLNEAFLGGLSKLPGGDLLNPFRKR